MAINGPELLERAAVPSLCWPYKTNSMTRAAVAGASQRRWRRERWPARGDRSSAIIHRAIAKAPQAVMLGLLRRFRTAHEREKRLLQDVLGFAMAQAQRPSVQDQIGRFGLVQSFAPPALSLAIHEST